MTSTPPRVGRELPRAAERACRAAFDDLGFTRRRGIFLRQCGDRDIWAWVGLPKNGKWYPLSVRAYVGVHDPAVDKLLAECEGLDGRDPSALAVTNVGYVMPVESSVEWYFWDAEGQWYVDAVLAEWESLGIGRGIRFGHDLAATARDLVETVVEYGVPYVERLAADVQALIQAVDADDIHRSKDLPAVLACAGRAREARRVLEQELEARDGKTYAEAVEYRAFAERLFGRISDAKDGAGDE